MFKSISKHIRTKGNNDCHNITKEVQEELAKSGLSSGLLTVFVPGATAAVTTIEYEDGAVKDLSEAFERLVPRNLAYQHDQRWNDGNGYSHVRAALLGPSLTVPFAEKKLKLGQWQQIILIDFDNRNRDREYLVNILGE